MPPWFSMPSGAFAPGPLPLSPATPAPTSRDSSTHSQIPRKFCKQDLQLPDLDLINIPLQSGRRVGKRGRKGRGEREGSCGQNFQVSASSEMRVHCGCFLKFHDSKHGPRVPVYLYYASITEYVGFLSLGLG